MNFVNGMGYTMPYPQVYGSLPQYYCQASGFLYPVGVPMVVYQPGMIEQQIAGSTIPVKKSDKYGEGQTEELHRGPEDAGRPTLVTKKKNLRNIIPNLAHKILRYISSDDSRSMILKVCPSMSGADLAKFYEYTSRLRKSLRFYIGNKNLTNIWYRQSRSPRQREYYRLIRILSRHFLNSECVQSILLSRRMKPSLKEEHLRCRRKILALLNRGDSK